ncbi:MAG: hypothetical protein LZ158_04745 [Thaumarchaeota archaeon]|nr:hypothetical protein [Candidatus Terraquivivens yellowstonensis]MCL7392268.1 hypothetical protein [Candidatus Terraquivivens yellowstonensis]MCL7395302.1 hypothetical protein [Candidatus Terraquivivens yellowstonensis]MCL7397503.1 hypothetical protein [Candidatus Terraquivivens yellowstonensis]MCL7399462.1 hypothetical protein [Candidatus Terraquivivens yellowstonensis]
MSGLVKIGNLTPWSRSVNLLAKVVKKGEEKFVASKFDQREHKLSETLIADETGAITLVLWDDNVDKINEGDVVMITNAFVKPFKGFAQLNLGRYGSIEIVNEEMPNVNIENNLSAKAMPREEGFSGPRGRKFQSGRRGRQR